MNKRLFTSEAVSEGHPDKVADQISDAILDNFLRQDEDSHVAVETMVTTGQVIVAGEVSSQAYVDVPSVVRDTIRKIGYTKSEYGFTADSCGILTAIHEQSPDIARGVNREVSKEQGAGDQGIMFGYATNETDVYIPATLHIANTILKVLSEIRHEGHVMEYLRPDSKSQVTMELDENGRPKSIDTIVLSTQHDVFASDKAMNEQMHYDFSFHVLPRVKSRLGLSPRIFDDSRLLINPTGRFEFGGPAADTGLTGRKIICDTYGGYGAHGGGAFSGKDPSKVDRSAAYMARFIAKNLVAHGFADRLLIQLSYAIGVAEPVSVSVNSYGTAHDTSDERMEEWILNRFDLTPFGIINQLNLKRDIYLPTAAYGHFGRKPDDYLFPWENIMPRHKFIQM